MINIEVSYGGARFEGLYLEKPYTVKLYPCSPMAQLNLGSQKIQVF